jgi:L-threonylcarbamoyladenylate synthase
MDKKDIEIIRRSFEERVPVVIPTDTIYGICAPALDKIAVQRLYRIRKRNPEKPFLIIISSLKDISKFGIELDKELKNYLGGIWPGKVTVILDCNNKELTYLHRKTKSLAFRLPDSGELISLVKKVGPLVAPSANLEGMPEAKTITEAEAYFGKKATYIDRGRINGKASTIISLVGKEFRIIREGSRKIKKSEYFRSSINN